MDNKLLVSSHGKKFLVKNPDQDYHSQFGYVTSEQMKDEEGSEIRTNKDTKFFLLNPGFLDLYSKIKRGAQIIPLKDIGFIISETGINKNSVVLDAGAGSGGIALFLANIVKKVTTMDIREDHLNIVKKNAEYLGLKNISAKLGSIYEEKLPKGIDLVTLDVPDPWLALEHILFNVKPGGFIVSYSPHIPQTIDFVEATKKIEGIVYLKTVEIIEREWEIDGRKARPKTQQRITHSGFLSFVRKVKR